jgi:hypothetical protein
VGFFNALARMGVLDLIVVDHASGNKVTVGRSRDFDHL